MKHCLLENIRLSYRDKGAGMPILLVHGYPFHSLFWNRTIGLLADNNFRVIAPDLRGFGLSVDVTEDNIVTMEQFADDLYSLLQLLDITEKVCLVGLSMGGYIAMQFARKYPDVLSRLVLCGTRTIADMPLIVANRRTQASSLRDGTLMLKNLADTMIPKLFSAATKEQKPELLSELRNMIETQHADAVAAAALGMAERSDTTEVLRRLTIPTLMICGTEDQFSPPDEMHRLAEIASKGTFVEIPDSGHLSPIEQPERFADALCRFCNNLS